MYVLHTLNIVRNSRTNKLYTSITRGVVRVVVNEYVINSGN